MKNNSEFNAEHIWELLRLAYDGKNYEEVYRYTTLILENAPNFKPARIRALKGFSACALSTPDKPRIEEMKVYLNKAIELDHNHRSLCSELAALAIGLFTVQILIFLASNKGAYQENDKAGRVLIPQKSVLTSFGSSIGAGIADGLSKVYMDNEVVQNNGLLFISQYQSLIMDGLKYAWEIDSTELTATNIISTFREVEISESIDKKAKKSFRNEGQSLINDVKQKYPKIEIPK